MMPNLAHRVFPLAGCLSCDLYDAGARNPRKYSRLTPPRHNKQHNASTRVGVVHRREADAARRRAAQERLLYGPQ
jgi:hypothetical protein